MYESRKLSETERSVHDQTDNQRKLPTYMSWSTHVILNRNKVNHHIQI